MRVPRRLHRQLDYMVLDDWDYTITSQPSTQQSVADPVGRVRTAPARYATEPAPPPSVQRPSPLTTPSVQHAAADDSESLASPNERAARKKPRGTPLTANLLEIARAAAAKAVLAMQKVASTPTTQPMTAKGALAAAKREGLELVLAPGTVSGYRGVHFVNGSPKPYQARLQRGGECVSLGYFATAEEAALEYARYVRSGQAGPQRAAQASSTPAPAARPHAVRPSAAAAAHAETVHLASVCSQLKKELRGMRGVAALLGALGMPQYADSFDEMGYDDAEYLLQLSAAKLEAVGQLTRMSSDHTRKMVDLLSARQRL